MVEQRQVLEGAADAQPGPRIGVEAGDVLAAVEQLAFGRLVAARNAIDVEQRSLSIVRNARSYIGGEGQAIRLSVVADARITRGSVAPRRAIGGAYRGGSP
jgi:hypothetical protein